MKRAIIITPAITAIEYYHFTSTERGERYFKVDRVNASVWCVCLSSGREKAGRTHCEGYFRLKMSSFNGTYYWYLGREKQMKNYKNDTRLKVTTENQFEIAKKKIFDTLK